MKEVRKILKKLLKLNVKSIIDNDKLKSENRRLKKIYGIYEGCLFEGGGVGWFFFKEKKKALFEAECLVLKRNKTLNIDNHFKKTSETEWKTSVDIISVIERELK